MSGVMSTRAAHVEWHISFIIDTLKNMGMSKSTIKAAPTEIKVWADFAVKSPTFDRKHPTSITSRYKVTISIVLYPDHTLNTWRKWVCHSSKYF